MNIKRFIIGTIVFLAAGGFAFGQSLQRTKGGNDIWKTGVAREIITPASSVWMAGFAARTSPSDGKLHDLWAKALVLEDAAGHRSVLVTMDLLSVPADFSERLKNRIRERHGLDKSQIILSVSHTHSGPVISRALKYIYPMNPVQWNAVDEYTRTLESTLIRLVDKAMQRMQPSRIHTGNGVTRFQVNRRNNNVSILTATTVLNGPNDYAVPVIKVEELDGTLKTVVFGYACHPTVLSGNQFSGDYAGFAQIELEKSYPGATAMFFQGAGADQNPLPRHSVPLAVQYGKELAAAVERVLSEDMVKQESVLDTRYNEIVLPFDRPLSQEQLQKMAHKGDYQARWAQGMMEEYKQNGTYAESYPYPVGYWKIGTQQLFILGGEVVVSYSVKLKELFGQDTFVMAYANDVMGYIPSAVIIEEGRYEGDSSQRVYGLPAKWDKQIETLIIENCKNLALGK